ncbi:hypothetical protein VIAQ111709_02695 [Vibrio aquimaris]|uniref:Uncharacterized protein n=1 Tax=Vibrio aquimaris TaxID=2587862 RepID=A0A5P9CIT7_9VIBR|nr:hypothetical protein FIV01_05230 [Vibrio aquimaris]
MPLTNNISAIPDTISQRGTDGACSLPSLPQSIAKVELTKNLSQKGFIPYNEATSKMQHGLVVFDFLFPTMSLKIIRLF